jgi:hypothetical protein
MFGGGLWLCLKSFKKMFDRKMREKISKITSRISKAISQFFDKIVKRVAKKLGIERKRVKGEDERDFVFKERISSKRRRNKMKNPHPWNDADNATRVRYIFTEFMFGKIREGYRARRYPRQDGIVKSFTREPGWNRVSIDGVGDCIAALEELREGRGLSKVFLEMTACEGSCVNGPDIRTSRYENRIRGTVKVNSYAGENDYGVREGVCADMEFFGIKIDVDVNKNAPRGEIVDITAPDGKMKVFIIPTDEEYMIAKDTQNLVNN